VGGGVLELVPWASCLGKFVFWSWGRRKLYIRVFDISFLMSLCCRVCAGANSGCSVFFWCVRRTASCVGQKEGFPSAKGDDTAGWRLTLAAGAVGVAGGGGRTRWEDKGTVRVGHCGGCTCLS
jgi:hypothetical protein